EEVMEWGSGRGGKRGVEPLPSVSSASWAAAPCCPLRRHSHVETSHGPTLLGSFPTDNRYGRPYSITSSASARSLAGISRPSALAVLRLITSSNLVDCWIGRSAGLSPLRIRPV